MLLGFPTQPMRLAAATALTLPALDAVAVSPAYCLIAAEAARACSWASWPQACHGSSLLSPSPSERCSGNASCPF